LWIALVSTTAIGAAILSQMWVHQDIGLLRGWDGIWPQLLCLEGHIKTINIAMITVAIETPKQPEIIHLLEKSVEYIRSLYPEEHAHTFKIGELTRKRSKFFVIRHQSGKAIGIGAYVGKGRKTVELKHMFVDAAARGMGAGRALLAYIEQIAIEDGVKKIILETSQKQVDAIGLYQSFGYTVCDPYTEHHSEDVFMEKML